MRSVRELLKMDPWRILSRYLKTAFRISQCDGLFGSISEWHGAVVPTAGWRMLSCKRTCSRPGGYCNSSTKWKWKSLSRVRLFATPWTIQSPGILQARILEWVAFLFSRGSSQPRDGTQVSHIAGEFFTSWATGEAHQSTSLCLGLKRRAGWHSPTLSTRGACLHFCTSISSLSYQDRKTTSKCYWED